MEETLFTADLQPSARAANGSARSDTFLLNAYIGDHSAKLVRVALEHLADGHAGCSPLVFYGPAAVGKTLLARIAAQRLQEMASPREVLFYSGASLSRACGLATETNSIAEFRRRLQQAGALVVDDLQQVSGKRLVEEELRYAVDELLRRHRWVVATSRSLPSETKGLAAGLASRMQSGLVVPVSVAGSEAKRVILSRLSLRHGLELGDDVINMLAAVGSAASSAPQSAIGVVQLDQMLARLKQEVDGDQPIDANAVRMTLSAACNANQPDLRTICAAVARYFDQKQDDLRGPARRKELVQARGIAMYLARQLTDKSLWQVGKHFGNRDHTTVLHACRRTQKLMQQDSAIRKAIEDLVSQFSM